MIPNSIPRCIGIIMDGNRRWAKLKNLPTFEGHRRGYEKLKEVMRWAKEEDVIHVIVYAFSTQNWERSKEEVSYLMDLFKFVLTVEVDILKTENIKVRCVGDFSRMSLELQNLIKKAEMTTSECSGPTLVLALSYGGRSDIVQAVNQIISKRLTSVSESDFSSFLWTRGLPDPDLIIRTSGEMRLSGFLPWEGVYSELYFTKTFWPDFSHEEFNKILSEFSERDRRKGK